MSTRKDGRKRLKLVTMTIRGLGIGDAIVIPEANGSVKSIVSRLRTAFKGRRRFRTQTVENSTLVQRLP